MNQILPVEILGNYDWVIIPFGLFLGLLGYRMYKISLFIIGFIFGFTLGSWVGELLSNPQLGLFIGIVLGFALGIVIHFLIRFSFFLTGVVGGLMLTRMILPETTIVAGSLESWAWSAVGGLGGGLLTVLLYRFLVLFAICLIGTYMIYAGTLDLFPPEMASWSWVLYAVLLVVFLLVQILSRRGHLDPVERPRRQYRYNF